MSPTGENGRYLDKILLVFSIILGLLIIPVIIRDFISSSRPVIKQREMCSSLDLSPSFFFFLMSYTKDKIRKEVLHVEFEREVSFFNSRQGQRLITSFLSSFISIHLRCGQQRMSNKRIRLLFITITRTNNERETIGRYWVHEQMSARLFATAEYLIRWKMRVKVNFRSKKIWSE